MCTSPKKIRKCGYYKNDNYHGTAGSYYEINTYTKCGVCPQCRNDKCNSWVVRNFYEAKAHDKIAFVTLTYAENPIILCKKDFQDFIKRFRRYLDYNEMNKIRYFLCAEYGLKSGRPHAHMLIYGWTDPKSKYLTINKRKNLVYQSEVIQKLWGLGRTSIQEYNQEEIPYTTLYCSPQEEFKRAYKMTREKAKSIKNKILSNKNMKKCQRDNIIKELEEIEKKLAAEKEKYYLIKEYNTWSIALGWEMFFDEYSKERVHTFEHQIGTQTICTPSPWLKKLANKYGDIEAANEMFRREKEMDEKPTEEEERIYQNFKWGEKKKKEIKEWHEKTLKNEENDEF